MFGEYLKAHFDAQKEVESTFNGFLKGLEDVKELVESFEEEGMAAEIVVNSAISTGLPDTLIGNFTNEKAASLLGNCIEVMRDGGSQKKYLWAALTIDSILHVNVFDPVSGESQGFLAPIPQSDGSLAGDIFSNLYIEKNLNHFANEQGAVIFWDMTNFLCGISNL